MSQKASQLTNNPEDKDPEHKKQPRAAASGKIQPPKDMPDPDQIKENDRKARAYINEITANIKQQKVDEMKKLQPVPAESTAPVPAEPSKEEMDERAKVQKAEGSSFPMPNIRPPPPNLMKEEGSVIVAKELAGQLGTSPEIKSSMRIDERKMAVLDDGTLAALSHFSYRNVYDGVRYWGHITEWWLTGSQGIGGLGRRHILQAIGSSSGVQSVEKAEKPNALARNVWDRNWKQKAEAEGKVVEE